MKLFYTDHFELPLPEGHRFPMAKYRRLRERMASLALAGCELGEPPAATFEQLVLAHTADYVTRVFEGTLTDAEVRRIGFPWSPAMVERSRRSTGATIAASRAALDERAAANLAGGTHHAGPDFGEGFCVFNDTAVACRVLLAERRIERAIVIDLDVHQGNGTAAILADEPRAFTFSMHAAKNFPLRKHPSDLDVGLADGTTDEEYLLTLDQRLDEALAAARPELAFYIAGADPFVGDRLGRMAMTKRGLAARDRLVLSRLRERSIPVAIAMGGGYAREINDIVDIHAQTITTAWELFRGSPTG